MLMPNKHIRVAESLLGLGAYVLQQLSEPQTIDSLWESYSNAFRAGDFPAKHSFENIVMAVDILFAIGAVAEDASGVLVRCA